MFTSCSTCDTDSLALDRPKSVCPECGGNKLLSRFSPAAVESGRITTELPGDASYTPYQTVREILDQGPSEAGGSAVGQWLSCPERSRLKAAGVKRKLSNRVIVEGVIDPLKATEFGSLYHALDSVRWANGRGGGDTWGALDYLEHLHDQLAPEDYTRASNMLRMHEYAYPLAADLERYEILANEVEIRSEIPTLDGKGTLVRTVRFDKLLRERKSGELANLELKTLSKGGSGVAEEYKAQRATGTAIYNANKVLVDKYGPLRKTFYQIVTKAATPKAERYGPHVATAHQIRRALLYLALPEGSILPLMPDGTYPQFLQNCWGRFGPCEYMSLCWEQVIGDYEWPEGVATP